jgi:small-conductance mechanosensitive channel
MNELTDLAEEFLALLDVRSIEAAGIEVLAAVAILLATFWVSRILQRSIDRRLKQDGHGDEATIRVYKNFARFLVMVPGLLLALHVFGINLSALFTTGGLFAVAMAFAMKNLSENLVSGMILRLERSIKPGDVLETDGTMVRVKTIGFRATVARTKDERDLVIPNAQLVQSRVANYTFKDALCRVETSVGIAYSSDLLEVRQTLESVCAELDWASSQHNPAVLLSGFGDSALTFKVRVWIEDPWDAGRRRASLNEAIWWGLKKAGIVIAFPQLDVHIDRERPMLNPERTL